MKRKAAQDDEYEPEAEEVSREASPKPKRHRPPQKKKKDYQFTEADVRTIEESIKKYGLNYKGIHRHAFSQLCSLNKLTQFIKSEEMLDIKESAKEGKV